MPAKSKEQEKLMRAVANNPDFAKKVGIKQSVGKEFMKKYDKGGKVKKAIEDTRKFVGETEESLPPPKGFKKSKPKKPVEDIDISTREGFNKLLFRPKEESKPVKKKEGGMLKTPDNPGLKKLPEGVRNKMGYMKKGGKIGMGMTKNNYKKGGKVSSCSKRADGCAVRGKTKGRMV